MQKTQIDIVSDVICPWCYVGKKHLENAIEQLGDKYDFEINWHPFQLDPTIPIEGLDRTAYMAKKFGDEVRNAQIHEHLTNIAQKAGIEFKFSKIRKIINTFGLHKLLYASKQEGIQNEMEDCLFRSYFTDAVDFTNEQELFRVMAGLGWSSEKVKQILADENIAKDVQDKINYFREVGIMSVPYFMINNKYALSGTQPTQVFKEVLEQAGQEIADAKHL